MSANQNSEQKNKRKLFVIQAASFFTIKIYSAVALSTKTVALLFTISTKPVLMV